jgi:hypothetical protein
MPRTVPIGGARSGRAVFRRGSNVLEYWLDHAEGFEIRDRRRVRGHVESVLVDLQSGRTHALVVRSSRLGRTRVMPADAIVAVEPFSRVLVPRRERSAPVRAGSATVRGVSAGRGALGRGARGAASGLAAGAVWTAPRVARAAETTGARCASGASRAWRRLALATTATYTWLRPRLSALARSTATNATALVRTVVRKTCEALTWLRPRVSAVGSTAGTQAATWTRDGARSAATVAHAAATWLGPRLRASFDDAGTGTPSVWHLPLHDTAARRTGPQGSTRRQAE